jgi:hypothetical protein
MKSSENTRKREETILAQLDRIRDALSRKPFQPFMIKMADGTTCTVRGRDWLSIPPVRRVREVAFYSLPEGGADDEFQTHWLNLALIFEVIVPGLAELSQEPSDPEGNGERSPDPDM